mmetsp:Transcript_80466/g.260073  ORF Transcript_80466/g.260073 Transcript_80466/m.260073 type:complete len:201 (+) Transcript_80466:459-1061(+)
MTICDRSRTKASKRLAMSSFTELASESSAAALASSNSSSSEHSASDVSRETASTNQMGFSVNGSVPRTSPRMAITDLNNWPQSFCLTSTALAIDPVVLASRMPMETCGSLQLFALRQRRFEARSAPRGVQTIFSKPRDTDLKRPLEGSERVAAKPQEATAASATASTTARGKVSFMESSGCWEAIHLRWGSRLRTFLCFP